MANDPIGTVYQDIKIVRGKWGYVLRVDDDGSTDRSMPMYNDALLAAIIYLASARTGK